MVIAALKACGQLRLGSEENVRSINRRAQQADTAEVQAAAVAALDALGAERDTGESNPHKETIQRALDSMTTKDCIIAKIGEAQHAARTSLWAQHLGSP